MPSSGRATFFKTAGLSPIKKALIQPFGLSSADSYSFLLSFFINHRPVEAGHNRNLLHAKRRVNQATYTETAAKQRCASHARDSRCSASLQFFIDALGYRVALLQGMALSSR